MELPNLDNLEIFDEIKQIPTQCTGCPVASELRTEATENKGIASLLYSIVLSRPDPEQFTELIDANPDIQEFMEQEDISITPEELAQKLYSEQGKFLDETIETAQERIKEYNSFIDRCTDTGPREIIVPRDNSRPAEITLCGGALNSAEYGVDVFTTARISEID